MGQSLSEMLSEVIGLRLKTSLKSEVECKQNINTEVDMGILKELPNFGK